jgi:chromosome partitioning protein
VKGLGWPHRWSSRGARGLGWPGASRHRHSEGEADVAPEVDASGTAGYSRVPDDSRHVVHGSPSRVVITLPDDDDHVLSAVAAGPPGRSALGGWGGAAPAVTAVGLAWLDSVPRESAGEGVPPLADETPDLVVIRSPATALEPDDERRPYAEGGTGPDARDIAPAVPDQEPAVDGDACSAGPADHGEAPDDDPRPAGVDGCLAEVPVSRETDEGVRPEGATGALAQQDEEQRVSRETASPGEPVAADQTPEDLEDGYEPDGERRPVRADTDDDDPRGDTQESSRIGGTVQTAPVLGDGQGDSRSVRMQGGSERNDGPGGSDHGWGQVTTASYGYEEQHRVHLVDSLPRVDESTPLAVEVAEDARRRISLVGRPFPPAPHTRILTVANQKGGVGKTTTTVNVAAAMAQSGLNVLVLDIDPQGNASTALGIDHHQEIPSLYDVVVDRRPLGEVLQACPEIPTLLCAPATIDLAGAEIELVSLVAREVRLQKALREYLAQREAEALPRIDYVFIDCPPSLSLLTVNAFVAADEVFIPIQCEYYALEGLSQLLKHIELIRGHLNPTLHVSSILLTMYDGRTRLSSQVADEVRSHFPETVLKTTVPRSVRISEAPSHGQTVMTYDPASSGALSYLEAAREVAEQVLTWPEASHHEERA